MGNSNSKLRPHLVSALSAIEKTRFVILPSSFRPRRENSFRFSIASFRPRRRKLVSSFSSAPFRPRQKHEFSLDRRNFSNASRRFRTSLILRGLGVAPQVLRLSFVNFLSAIEKTRPPAAKTFSRLLLKRFLNCLPPAAKTRVF